MKKQEQRFGFLIAFNTVTAAFLLNAYIAVSYKGFLTASRNPTTSWDSLVVDDEVERSVPMNCNSPQQGLLAMLIEVFLWTILLKGHRVCPRKCKLLYMAKITAWARNTLACHVL